MSDRHVNLAGVIHQGDFSRCNVTECEQKRKITTLLARVERLEGLLSGVIREDETNEGTLLSEEILTEIRAAIAGEEKS